MRPTLPELEYYEAFDALLSNAAAPVVALDAQGLITLWNRGAERIFGWSAAETIGRPLPAVPGRRTEESDRILQRVLGGERFDGIDVDMRRRDGSLVHLTISIVPLRNAAGEVHGMLAIGSEAPPPQSAGADLESRVPVGSVRSRTPYDGTPHDGIPHDSTPHDGTPHDGTLRNGQGDERVAPVTADPEAVDVLSRRIRELETQLRELQSRWVGDALPPHFLLNSLHAIAVLVRRNDPDEAIHVLASLGSLLRTVLYREEQSEIPLREEIEFLERYIDVHRFRFGDGLNVEVEVEPSTLDALVPKLILQPLVENSLRHGLRPESCICEIGVRARRVADELRIEVRDNGRGLRTTSGSEPREGIGLRTLRSRLAQLYGDRARFELIDLEGGGVLVPLVIPFRSSATASIGPVEASVTDEGGEAA